MELIKINVPLRWKFFFLDYELDLSSTKLERLSKLDVVGSLSP